MSRKTVLLLAITILLLFFWQAPFLHRSGGRGTHAIRHIIDQAGVLSPYDAAKFEQYTSWIFTESDVDIRFVFVRGTGERTIEEEAVARMDELGIGGRSRQERGVLLLYDVASGRLRIEVGYGLETYFPDAFLAYLTHDHTRDFFASGDITTGLRLLIRMLHHRIREQVLGHGFDPRVVEVIHTRHLSGGAGVSDAMPTRGSEQKRWLVDIDARRRAAYGPQPDPETAYQRYLKWLTEEEFDPRLDLFTPRSQAYLAGLPVSRAYFNYILMQEYGRAYRVLVRGNLALLYFTDDPLVSPHFFVRTDRGWRMDLVAEVANTRNRVGGVYTWDYCGRDDPYSRAFADQMVEIRHYRRLKDGDNRPLPLAHGR